MPQYEVLHTLLRDGKRYNEGDSITMSEEDAAQLIRLHAVQQTTTKPKAKKAQPMTAPKSEDEPSDNKALGDTTKTTGSETTQAKKE